jgi:hypothetical protein
MIWESYKEAVPLALAEVNPDNYKPATMHILQRFNGRIILEIRQQKVNSVVSRDEFEELRSLVGKV